MMSYLSSTLKNVLLESVCECVCVLCKKVIMHMCICVWSLQVNDGCCSTRVILLFEVGSLITWGLSQSASLDHRDLIEVMSLSGARITSMPSFWHFFFYIGLLKPPGIFCLYAVVVAMKECYDQGRVQKALFWLVVPEGTFIMAWQQER